MTVYFNGEPESVLEAAAAKYEQERNKRLRADGNDQYIEVTGEFRHFVDDPYADAGFAREPMREDVEFLLIGGGFASLIAAAALRRAGVRDIRVIDKAADFGGTWYWNRYPGVQCDIEAYIYLPMLEELGYTPASKYAFGSEILDYARAIARHLDLTGSAILQTAVTGMEWDEASARWLVATDRGDELRARFVVMATGPLHRPKLPGVPGIRSFRGHAFHTSRWDYAYTGGGERGGLSGLADKRVAIIGTGSTAIQCVPHLAQDARHLYVVQRTPAAADVRGDRPTDPEWAAALEPGWQAERVLNFTSIIDGAGAVEDLVSDGWTSMYQELTAMSEERAAAAAGTPLGRGERSKLMSMADLRTMERIRARIDAIVDDPQTAERLKPWFGRWCKRPQFHDLYYLAFNRPNVTLLDTDGKGVERVTERGIVVAGVEYEVDCIIFATGYEVGTDYTRRSEYDVVGREGVKLSAKWADGMRTFQGMFSAGFPNCFFLGQTQTGLTANYVHTLTEQTRHLGYVIEQARRRHAVTIEASAEAEDEYVADFERVAIGNSSYYRACTPGFFTNEGHPEDTRTGFFSTFYGLGPLKFFELLRAWREQDELAGLVLRPGPRPARETT